MSEFTAIIRSIEDRQVLLETENGKQAMLPLRNMPGIVEQGHKLHIEVLSEEQFTARRKDIAKALLNEILGDNEKAGQSQKQG